MRLKYILITLILGLNWVCLYSEKPKGDLKGQVIALGDKRFVPVSRITSEALNKQFLNGVQMLRQQMKMLSAFDEKLSALTVSDEIKETQKQRDDLAQRIETNRVYLVKNYQYNISRDFLIVVEDSHIFRPTSEEELDQLKKDSPDQDWEASVRRAGDKIFILAKVLEGETANKEFENYAKAIQLQLSEKEKQEKFKEQVLEGTKPEFKDTEKQKEFFEYYYQLEKVLDKNETYMLENYNVSAKQGFVRVVINSRLHVEVTDDELERLPVEGASVLFE